MEVPKDVLPQSSEVAVEETTEVITPEVVVPAKPIEVKGTKTPEANLYAALEEERRKRKELEEKLLATSEPQVSEAFSDEGKLLEKQIHSMKSEIDALKNERALSELQSQYPQLRDLSAEFNAFKADFPASKSESVAKLFLMEKGLLDTPRKGLERQTSGGQVQVSDGLTAEEVADLRRNNHRKYTDMLMAGKIKLDELK
jgi:hypothetical protein